MVSFWRGFSLKFADGHFYASCLDGLFCVPAQRGRERRREGHKKRGREGESESSLLIRAPPS